MIVRTLLGAVALAALALGAAEAQPVTVIGPVTPGNCVAFNSTTVLKDAGPCGIVGALPVASGGTGLISGASGGILGFTASNVIASSGVLSAGALVLGGGAGATPTALGSLGTTTTVLHGNVAGAPSFGAVNLTADVSGILPVASGGTGIAAGTSGGVLAFTATGTTASSGALTANNPVIGGGAGVAPSSGTRSGNTTVFATVSGSFTNGHCLQINSGNIVDAGAICSGTGLVTAGLAGQVAIYPSNGSTIIGSDTIAFSSALENSITIGYIDGFGERLSVLAHVPITTLSTFNIFTAFAPYYSVTSGAFTSAAIASDIEIGVADTNTQNWSYTARPGMIGLWASHFVEAGGAAVGTIDGAASIFVNTDLGSSPGLTFNYSSAIYVASPSIGSTVVNTRYGILVKDQLLRATTNYAIKTEGGLLDNVGIQTNRSSLVLSDYAISANFASAFTKGPGTLTAGVNTPLYTSVDGGQSYNQANTAFNNNANGPGISFVKTRATNSTAASTTVQNNDVLALIDGWASNGTNYKQAFSIKCSVDGSTISTTSMPGRCEFFVTPSGSVTPALALRIVNGQDVIAGKAGMGTTSTNGFFWIPAGAGIPTGTPAITPGNFVPLYYDASNDKLCAYNYLSNTWKCSGAFS